MAPTNPAQPTSAGQDVTREMVLSLAFGQELTRVTRRMDEADKRAAGFEAQADELAGLLTQNANDIKALVSRADKQEKGAPPRSWLLAEDVGQAVADLEDLTRWLGRVYLRYPGAELPSCWAWHPGVVEELWWLRQAHREAYALGTHSVAKAGDWHDRSRPGVVARLAVIARDCDLSRHIDGGDRIQDPPVVPLAGEAERLATHWVKGGTPLPTPDQLDQARFADQRQRRTRRDVSTAATSSPR
jgi:hypothetical protein